MAERLSREPVQRHRLRLLSLPSMREAKGLLLLGGGYLLGSVFGVALAGAMEGESLSALRNYLEQFCALAGGGGTGHWRALVWNTFRWPLLALALRFTVLGVLLLPAALGAKGFLLSFAISAFVRGYGLRGVGAALLVFALPELAETAILFLLAQDSWQCAGRNGEPLWTRGELQHCGAGLLVMVGSVLAQSACADWFVKGLRLLLP